MKKNGSLLANNHGITAIENENTAKKTTKCVICEQPAQKEFFPFCSQRCRLRDLHNWLSESYSLPRPLTEEDLSEFTELSEALDAPPEDQSQAASLHSGPKTKSFRKN